LSDSESSDSSEGETSWKRAPRNPTAERPSSPKPPVDVASTGRSVRRRNQIWGDIAQEEALTGNMTVGFGVQALPEGSLEDRGVESYDYTRSLLDPRPRIEPVPTEVPEELLQLRAKKRAKNVRSRLGVPESIEKVDEQSKSNEAVTEESCKRLKEPKSELIGRAVEAVGTAKALELLYASETIEANGGLMINNGSRRRTPGGVFLHLLRNDSRIDKKVVDEIFEPEQEQRKVAAKKRKRDAIERRAAKVIRNLEKTLFGDEVQAETTDDEEDTGTELPCKKAMSADAGEEIRARTSDLEDGEIDE